ncbi:hypothetical protein scyTo_0025158, partial [Scyliorhinus torazame]|nr:hypothetical protein [Scyliorhinus torazame]
LSGLQVTKLAVHFISAHQELLAFRVTLQSILFVIMDQVEIFQRTLT